MAKNITTAPEKGVNGTKIFLVIFAAIALAGIITASVFGVVGAIGKKPFDYEKASLNKYRKYIEISESEYKNYEVLINLDPVTDLAVQNEIIKLQYANRKSGDGKNKIGQTIKVGDTANIYYYGYTLDENGEIFFDMDKETMKRWRFYYSFLKRRNGIILNDLSTNKGYLLKYQIPKKRPGAQPGYIPTGSTGVDHNYTTLTEQE